MVAKLMSDDTVKRLLTSRKFWGALFGTVAMILTGKLMSDSSAAVALPYVGGFWIAAIGGQAVADAIKTNKVG